MIEDDITRQTELVMENIKAILEAADSSLDRTVKTTVYLKDMNDFDAMGKVYSSLFSVASAGARHGGSGSIAWRTR